MPGPLFVFAFIVATMIGAAFHLIIGGDARRLALFLLASWIGFAIGQFTTVTLGLELFTIGDLRMLGASIGAFILLSLAHVLTTGRSRRSSRS